MRYLSVIVAACGLACLGLCVYLVVTGVRGGQPDDVAPQAGVPTGVSSADNSGAGSSRPEAPSPEGKGPALALARASGTPVRQSPDGGADSNIPPQPAPPSTKGSGPPPVADASIQALLKEMRTGHMSSDEEPGIVARAAAKGDSIIDDLMAGFRADPRDTTFRHRVLLVLSKLATPKARDALFEIVNMDEETVNRVFAAAIFCGTSSDGGDVQKLLDCRHLGVQAIGLERLRAADDEHFKKVLELAQSPLPELRWTAIRRLGWVSDSRQLGNGLAAAIRSLASADEVQKTTLMLSGAWLSPGYSYADQTRVFVIDALGEGRWSTESLAKAQEGLSGLSRDAVVIARASRGDKAVYEDLWGIIQTRKEGWVCLKAVEALCKIGTIDDLPLLKKIAEDTQWKVQIGTNLDGSENSYYPIRPAARWVQQQIQEAAGK
jgi:HEAT repeat protein